MRNLAELYAQLDVPVAALLVALDRLRLHSVASYSRLGADADAQALGDTLSHLCNMIRKEMKRHDGSRQHISEADIK